jgi:hypothetical protein
MNTDIAPNNPDYLSTFNTVFEVAHLAGKDTVAELQEAIERVPHIPRNLVVALADDCSTLLQARLGATTPEGELLGHVVQLLSLSKADPVTFARAAQLYERMGGSFDCALQGSFDKVGRK